MVYKSISIPSRLCRTPVACAMGALAALLSFQGVRGEEEVRSQLQQVDNIDRFVPGDKDFRIYLIGNSITRHGFNADTIKKLKWDRNAGMAASTEKKDYAHLVAEGVSGMYPQKEVKLFFGPGGNAVGALEGQEIMRIYKPDLVIVQLGEHIPSKAFGDEFDEAPEKIASDYRTLLGAIRALPSTPAIICTGIWNPVPGATQYKGRDAEIDGIMSRVCREYDVPFVSVEQHALDPSCSGSGESGGVRWHPNDKGHAGYAGEIMKALKELTQNPKKDSL